MVRSFRWPSCIRLRRWVEAGLQVASERIFWRRALALVLVPAAAGWACARDGGLAADCPTVPAGRAVEAPSTPACDNELLTAFEGLLILAPHPDDEVLGFAGLATAYREQGKPVDIVVATDGDAYCEACRFWKSLSVTGPTCSADDLTNFATAEVDSFAEVRRGESRAAADVLGLGPPTFLGYPDTGLAAAWRNANRGEPDRPLHRSDFSACGACETCAEGYGGGPATELSSSSLRGTLAERIAATPPGTLLATTHWLDGHGDHSALGNFVKTLNDAQDVPRAVVYAVIHAHTPRDTAHPDCWYPGPAAPVCPCALQHCAEADSGWLAALRRHRLRPDWPATLPDDAPYGTERQLCLADELHRGEGAGKLRAIRSFGSQLGFTARGGGEVSAAVGGMIDCNGYLTAFARRTEAFVLHRPAEEAACDVTGVWRGAGGVAAGGSGEVLSSFTVELEARSGRRLAGQISWLDATGQQHAAEMTGEVLSDCRVSLRSRRAPQVTYEGTVSRDRASLYGFWEAEGGGFFVVHR